MPAPRRIPAHVRPVPTETLTETTEAPTPMRMVWLTVALLALSPASLGAQPGPAGVVTSLTGQATVVRAAAPAPVALKFKDGVFVRDRIETRQDSIVRVLLGGKALVTVRELSVFTVTEEPGRARIDLAEGKLAVGVAKSLLRPGEAIEIRTPNAVAAVRGSELVAEVTVSGGVPQTTFTALQISLPVTVTPLNDPRAMVTLGINQAVSLLGLATAPTVTPIRNLTPAQAQEAARTGQAPKPREQSERAPERVTQKVTEEKTREAAQLSETLVSGGGLGERAVSSAVAAELAGFQVADVRTQDLFIATSLEIDTLSEITRRAIEEAFEAEPPFNPQFVLVDQVINAGVGETVKTYTGTVRETFSPIVDVLTSRITQSGAGTFFKVEPGANVTVPGFFAFVQDSEIATGGTILSVGAGASLRVGLGIFGLLEFDRSTVVTGAELAAVGAGASLVTDRPLVTASDATFVAGATVDGASFVSIGEGTQVRTSALPFLSLNRTSVTASGNVLAIGPNASVTTGPGLFALLTADGGSVSAGAEVLAIEHGARIDLHQGLVSGVDATFASGGSPEAFKPFVRVGPGARVTSDTTNPFLLIGGGSLTAVGSVLALEDGASVVSTGASTLPFLLFTDTDVVAGGDVFSLAPTARLALDRPFAIVNNSTVDVGGSVFGLSAHAVVSVPESLTVGALLFVDSLVRTGADLIRLDPAAQLGLNRPILAAQRSTLVSIAGGLLGLGAGAVLASPEVTTGEFMTVLDTLVSAGGNLFTLGPSARLDLVRPLLFAARSSFGAAEHALFLDDAARLVSSGATFAFLSFSDTDVATGGSLAHVHPGARVDLGRSLVAAFEGALSLARGILTVAAGGQVASSTPDPLALLVGGTHAIASDPGSAMFDLAGAATALDPESGLTVGTDRPVHVAGSVLGVVGGTLTGQTVARIDTALLEASRPLMQLVGGAVATIATDVVDLSLRAKVTSLGPVLTLDASTLSVVVGALVKVAGGSFLKVVGDFLDMRNGSTLNLLNGPVLSVGGGSVVNVTGGLVNFGGTAGNRLNVANTLCPCTVLSGVPVALQNGATAANVSIGPNPIRNPGLGTLALSSPNAAAIVVSGPTSRVTIGAP